MPVSYKAEGTLEIFTYRLQGRNLKVKNFNSKAMASAVFFFNCNAGIFKELYTNHRPFVGNGKVLKSTRL